MNKQASLAATENIERMCSFTGSIILYLPFIALLMVAGSVGRSAPHDILEKIDTMVYGKNPFRRIAVCYRLYKARYSGSGLKAFEALLAKMLGNNGRVLGRIYAVAYTVRGDKLYAVNEFIARASSLFTEYVQSRIGIVRELSKLVVMLVAALVLAVSIAAFVTLNFNILSLTAIISILVSMLILIIIDLNKLIKLIINNKYRMILDIVYLISVLFTVGLAIRGYKVLTLIAAASSLAVSSYILLFIQKYIKNLNNIIIILRHIKDSFSTVGRIPAILGDSGAQAPYRGMAGLMATLSGVGGGGEAPFTTPLERLLSGIVSQLVYGGTYKHLHVVEDIVEKLARSLRQVYKNVIYLNITVVVVYVAAALSAKILLSMFTSAAVGSGPNQLISAGSALDASSLQILLAVDALALASISLAATFTMIGTIAAPSIPAIIAVYTALSLR